MAPPKELPPKMHFLTQKKIYLLNYQGRTGLGMGFASFVKSEVGQRIILKSGLAPVKIPTREIRIVKSNKKK